MNILIVDDKEDNRYLMEALLRGNGYVVYSAENGADALDYLKSNPVDLIITDILMPIMDGFELCRQVRTNETLRHIPLIIYTATYTGPKDEEFAMKIGADRFILKPCEPDVFMDAVREVMAAVRNRDIEMVPGPQEEEVLKLYNERLVRKLEQKMLQLEKETAALMETQAELRESREKYKDILDNIVNGYYEVDLAGNLAFFNRACINILGYSEAELMGMNNQTFMDKENARKVFETFHQVYTTGEPYRALDWELIRKDGTICYVDTSISLMRDKYDQAIGFRGVLMDITERKQAEKKKKELEDQLHQAQKMESVGRVAGGVAHDFNNLLSIILGYGEILLEKLDDDAPVHEMASQIYQAGIRARGLTRQLLAFSRKQVLEMKVVDVNHVVTGFEKLLRRLIGEDVQLTIAQSPDPLMVNADATQLEQVLMNLAVNARDAMPDGGVLNIDTCAVRVDEDDAEGMPDLIPGNYTLIEVSDTGAGMGKDILERIFEPFFTTKEMDKGTGLGLATCYGIIKQHQGNILVYSEPGQGTTFKIYLPLCAQKGETESDPEEFLFPESASATVLIVEDDSQVRRLACRILAGHGYSVIESDDVTDAIAIAASHDAPIHLVLSDVIMPQMKGPEAFAKIREYHPEARALYMSGYTDDMIVRQGVLQEGIQYIQKPFTIKGLLEKCHQVLHGE
jgi:PAS domain S-box-containing protein